MYYLYLKIEINAEVLLKACKEIGLAVRGKLSRLLLSKEPRAAAKKDLGQCGGATSSCPGSLPKATS